MNIFIATIKSHDDPALDYTLAATTRELAIQAVLENEREAADFPDLTWDEVCEAYEVEIVEQPLIGAGK